MFRPGSFPNRGPPSYRASASVSTRDTSLPQHPPQKGPSLHRNPPPDGRQQRRGESLDTRKQEELSRYADDGALSPPSADIDLPKTTRTCSTFSVPLQARPSFGTSTRPQALDGFVPPKLAFRGIAERRVAIPRESPKSRGVASPINKEMSVCRRMGSRKVGSPIYKEIAESRGVASPKSRYVVEWVPER